MSNTAYPRMEGKICLVTGATAGIGRVTARQLAALGAEVVIAGRNQLKTESVARQIQAETGNAAVHFLLADFADLDQVREMAAAFKARYPRLDVLVNNAGAFFNTRQSTLYGVEKTFLVNHLSPFLLTNLLLEMIPTSDPARIINVSSEAYKQGTLDFDDLGFARKYFGMKAYARSKLANILFTTELARHLPADRVTANALHPGHVATDIWENELGFFGPLIKWVISKIALTPEEGADNSVYLAASPQVAGITGEYFVKRVPTQIVARARSEAVARQLWDQSTSLTGIKTKFN